MPRVRISIFSTGLPQARPHPSKAVERTWVRLAALSLCRREDEFGYGAQALVVQGRPPADGVGQVFDFAGRGGEASRSLARCDQAHGLASRPDAETQGHQEELASVAPAVRDSSRTCAPAPSIGERKAADRRSPNAFSTLDLSAPGC